VTQQLALDLARVFGSGAYARGERTR